MPSYVSYKNKLKAILDADDTEIESWITVRGNHIPIMKGQSKEEAVKSFIEHQAGKNDTPQGVKWTPTNKKGEGTGNVKKEEKPKYNIQHGAKLQDIESMINKHADKKGYKSWEEEEQYVAEKLKEEGIYAYGNQIKEAMKNVYGEEYTKGKESKKRESAKQRNEDFEKAKQILPAEKQEPYLNKIGEINKKYDRLRAEASTKEEKAKIDKEWSKQGREVVKEMTNAAKKTEYEPEFEVVRKNALANGSVYGGKYTQKSKAEAYKEYKNDISSKENLKKANEFVNGTKNKLYGINNNKQVFSIKGGRVVVDPELKTANWYNSKGALTLKQKDLDTDAFIKHGVNELGWQKMTEKEESVLKEFQKIANKPEYKDKEVEAGFEMLPKDYTIAHKDKNGKTTVIAEVSHHDINQPASVEETEAAVEKFFEEQYTKNEAKALSKEYKQYKTHIANLENLLKENRKQQQNTPYNSYTATRSLQLRREEERLIKELHDAEKDFAEFKHYELS